MTALYWAASDSLTLIGRNVRHSVRSIDAFITAVALPVMILLLFTYVFGGAIDAGAALSRLRRAGHRPALGGLRLVADRRRRERGHERPASWTASARFRSRRPPCSPVTSSRASCATCSPPGSWSPVALLIGFHPRAGPAEWLGVAGLLLAFMTAISWLAACFGLLAGSAEAAGAFTFVVMFLPYVSSAFVPTDTMPAGLRVDRRAPAGHARRRRLAGAHARRPGRRRRGRRPGVVRGGRDRRLRVRGDPVPAADGPLGGLVGRAGRGDRRPAGRRGGPSRSTPAAT